MRFKAIIFFQLAFICQLLMAQRVPNTAKNISQESSNTNYHNFANATTFSKQTILYSEPDTLTPLTTTLSFNKSVIILNETEATSEKIDTIRNKNRLQLIKKTYNILSWYKIKVNDTIAFAKASDVASHTFFSNDSLYKYFFVKGANFFLHKYNLRNKKIIDSYEINNIRRDVIEKVNINGWKNTSELFRITQVDAFCGGGIYDKYIIDANNNLSSLFTTKLYYSEDETNSYQSTLWIPIKDSTKNTVLAQKGSSTDIAASFSDEKYLIESPKNISVKKNELLIFKEVQKQHNKEKIKTSYYKWNGQKLILVKNETAVK